MNSLRWVCSHARDWNLSSASASASSPSSSSSTSTQSNAAEVRQLEDPLDLMVRQFEDNQKQLQDLRNELARAKTDLTRSHTELNKHKSVVAAASKNWENHHRAQADQRDKLMHELAELRARTKNQTNVIKSLKSDAQAKRTKTIISEQQLLLAQKNNLQQKLAEVQQRLADATFEIERLKCVELARVDTCHAILPQPFVMVLVDGDAYSWATSLYRYDQPNHSPGALAANELHNSVYECISQTPDVSPASKIVARVFFNELGMLPTTSKYRNILTQQKRDRTTFRRDFTQAMPLFDFFDVGAGKERADQKLRANFDLFLTHPHCQHVFLAVCTDNGFARMLESHRYGETRSKITLVSPGYVCKEIEELGFRTVVWSTVFKERKRTANEERSIALRTLLVKEEADYNKRMGFEGTVNTRTAAYVQDIVPGHNTWIVDTIQSVRRRGIRSSVSPTTRVPATPARTSRSKPEVKLHMCKDSCID